MSDNLEKISPALPPFSAEDFRARRQTIAEKIGKKAVAVVAGAGPVYGFDNFRQTNEFYYLCGNETPQAYLLIEGGDGRTILFLPERDAKAERSEGWDASRDPHEATLSQSGAEEIRPTAELVRSLRGAAKIYLPLKPAETVRACRDTLAKAYQQMAADPWDGRVSREELFSRRLQQEFPTSQFLDLTQLLDELRSVKSSAEIAVMRCAGRLTGRALAEAIRSTRPGIIESQLGAVADYYFLLHGAKCGGYRPIIAGGDNIWFPHYYRNNCRLQDGDLVLMDYAPEVNYYTSDIGRMWPVNGRYQPWQRALYGFMVEYHKTLLRHIRPGVDDKIILAESAAEMEKTLSNWSFSKPCHREAAQRTLSFAGHLSHPVGMSVHDSGEYHGNPLKVGTVFALDPQMWVPEEQLYIRVEDTVAVTKDGMEVLTTGAPLELDEMEDLVAEEGLLQKAPPDAALMDFGC